MKLIIAGVGPGNPDLITLEAINAAKDSDLILVPCSQHDKQGLAEKIILAHIPEANILRIFFPMISDVDKRDEIIHEQLIKREAELQRAQKIFFPVIGDSLLYSTGAYLVNVLTNIFPKIDTSFIPGISAHSLAASYAKKFLAMSDEIISIIPGTADPDKITNALKNSKAIAIYKPKALKNLRELVENTGPYDKIFRVDFAGIPDKEKVYEGEKALKNVDEYLSLILLWRNFYSSESLDKSQYQKRILEMARQDYLTGLATRWYLQEYIENKKNEENITCIYFDLDNFKKVNDTYGHQAGDRALAATAEMIQREFTDGFAARMGGDEFMVVLPGLRTASEVESKVNLFMKNLLDYYRGVKTMNVLSISAGISQKLKGVEKSIDRLIHESDIALYEAKKSGKARCKIYNPSMEAATFKA